MILSDIDLLEQLESGELVVDPIDDLDTQIQPASIDLRLGNTFLEFERTNIPCIHPDNPDEIDSYISETHVDDGDEIILHPGDFVLGTTYETVKIPNDLVATLEGRSSLGRLAIIVHATAGWIDNGFEGQITLELSNLGNAPVALTPGMRVSQLVVMETKSPCKRPYGAERGSKYQHQSGPAQSKIDADVEYSR